jgi:molybdopterin converting factor small subunit
MGIFDRMRGGTIRIRVLIKGRIGDGWKDIDEHVRVPAGTTLGKLLEITAAADAPLREALSHSPHLTETMTLNGERCPLHDNEQRVLADGDEIYLAPLAG